MCVYIYVYACIARACSLKPSAPSHVVVYKLYCGSMQPAAADRSCMHPGSKAALQALLIQMYGCGRQPDRDITFVEIFAGEASVSKGMRLLGYEGQTLDLRKSLTHDILTPAGFLTAMAAAMRIRRGGVLWAAPPCSTWIFLSRHSTGRDKDPSGNWQTSAYVASQNALVCRLLLLARLCIARGVYYIIEQPRSSCMFEYAPFAAFLQKHPATSVSTEMGAFGMKAEKDTILMGTAPYLPMLVRRLTPEQRKEIRSDNSKKQTAVVSYRADGSRNVHGGRDLKSTQAYPIGFGCAHALSFQSHDNSAVAVEVKRRRVGPPPAAAEGPREAASSGSCSPADDPADASDLDDAADDDSAAADVAPNSFLPARELQVGSRTLADDLADMSDDEDPWYLDDLCTWNPTRWHDNSAEEFKLTLS